MFNMTELAHSLNKHLNTTSTDRLNTKAETERCNDLALIN